jgi:hypothetical protein
VAGTIDYMIVTSFISPAGVVDLFLSCTLLRFENRFVFQEPEYLKNEIRKIINKKEVTT